MKIVWRGEQFMRKLEGYTEEALQQTAEIIRDEAKLSMLQPKHGKPVKMRGFILKERVGKQRVTRSAPGEAPAVQTGRLYGSLEVVKDQPLSRIIIARDRKAHLLELGTRNIAPRPFLRPALWAHQSEVVKNIREKMR